MSCFNKLKFKVFHPIKDFPRNVKYGIVNLVKWVPIIWGDRQWDNHYIYKVLRHKLHLTEQMIRHNGHHVRNIQDADKIKTCVVLLDRLMEDDYHEIVSKKFYEKWGRPDFNISEGGLLNIDYPNVKNDEDEKKQVKEFRRLIVVEEEMVKQDLALLFKMMQKHIRTWWD